MIMTVTQHKLSNHGSMLLAKLGRRSDPLPAPHSTSAPDRFYCSVLCQYISEDMALFRTRSWGRCGARGPFCFTACQRSASITGRAPSGAAFWSLQPRGPTQSRSAFAFLQQPAWLTPCGASGPLHVHFYHVYCLSLILSQYVFVLVSFRGRTEKRQAWVSSLQDVHTILRHHPV